MNELLTINPDSMEYKDAMTLHTQIITSGSVAASALVDMCQGMKKMRDSRQYIYLGYNDFDEYAVSACRMKARQAYTYISTIERLGETALQSNANLGITKLALLASVSEEQRADILENNDVEDMSTRELQALTEELTKAREQISLLTEQANLTTDNDITAVLEADLEAIRAEKEAAISAALKATEGKDAAVAAAIKSTENAWKDKIKTEKEKAAASVKKETEKQIEQARLDGMAAGQKAAQQGLEAVEREKAEALARAVELEKQMSVASNSETVLFQHLFNELQNDFNKMVECAERISAKDPEAGKKYIGVVRKMVLEIMPGQLAEASND